jgi:hypothetical protein
MSGEFPNCPFCDSTKVLWVIYNVPALEEERLILAGKAIFGGPDSKDPRATFYCKSCEQVWFDPEYALEGLPALEAVECTFCGGTLLASERLRYEVDAEEYLEVIIAKLRGENPPKTLLQPETFAARPHAICDKCRCGIHDNFRDRQEEDEARESGANRHATVILRVLFAAIGIFVLGGLVISILWECARRLGLWR